MKIQHSLLFAGLLLATAALAGPPTPDFAVLRDGPRTRAIQPGEKIVFVCAQCPPGGAGGMAKAMDACQDGGRVTCESCRATKRVVFKGMPKSPTVSRETVYTNGSGRDCVFVPRIVAAK